MWQFLCFNENGDYKFIHPELGTNTVGKYSEENPNGATSIEHALEIVNGQEG